MTKQEATDPNRILYAALFILAFIAHTGWNEARYQRMEAEGYGIAYYLEKDEKKDILKAVNKYKEKTQFSMMEEAIYEGHGFFLTILDIIMGCMIYLMISKTLKIDKKALSQIRKKEKHRH